MAVVALLVFFAGTAVLYVVSTANYGNRTEVELAKNYSNNQNVLGQYTLKVQEVASVPEMYKNDLKDVMTSVMQARMGEKGSQALFQFFKEQNIPFDSNLYGNIQQVVEAGRNEFQTSQTRLIDVRGTYQVALGSIPKGWVLGMLGYPKVDLSLYDPVLDRKSVV